MTRAPTLRPLRRAFAVIAGLACSLTVFITHTDLASLPPRLRTPAAWWLGFFAIFPLVIAVMAGIALAWSWRAPHPDHSSAVILTDSVVPRRLDRMWIRGTGVGVCACFVMLLGTPLAVGGSLGSPAQGTASTLVTMSAFIAIIMAVVCFGVHARFIWAGVVVTALLVALSTITGELWPGSVQAPAQVLSTTLLFVGAVTWLRVQLVQLDQTEAQEREQAEALADEQARQLVRLRVNAFVHDHILAALVPVAAGMPDSPLLRSTACAALGALDSSDELSSSEDSISTEELFDAMTKDARAWDSGIRIERRRDDHFLVPSDTGKVLGDAVIEAVRNSVRHGGPGPVRRVLGLEVVDGALTVSVDDDGQGFIPEQVPRSRYGIRHSIRQRVVDVGGLVDVRSSPGRGTHIAVSWSPGPAWAHAGGDELQQLDAQLPSDVEFPLAASLETRTARILAVLFLAMGAIQVLGNRSAYTSFVPVIGAFVVVVIAVGLLVRSWPRSRLPGWVCVVVVVLIAVANSMCLWSIRVGGWPGYATWSIWACVFLCWGPLMRERTATGWIGFAAMAATTFGWVLDTGQPVSLGFALVLPQVISTAAWTFIAWASARFACRTALANRRVGELSALRHAQQETIRITHEAMDTVAQRAHPVLQRIATDPAPSPEFRLECLLLEAELRDEIRGAFFTGTPVVEAAREARARGAEVVLMDDSTPGTLGPVERTEVIDHVMAALASATDGSHVFARIAPPERSYAASVVVDDESVMIPRAAATQQSVQA
ncbi:ATP-binding protein [Propionibacterium sp.]|uniref:ATP-binding protein n=1 Tax=Propionibacterium sp. TaxID=1977903 RepID=UPI0039E8F7DA